MSIRPRTLFIGAALTVLVLGAYGAGLNATDEPTTTPAPSVTPDQLRDALGLTTPPPTPDPTPTPTPEPTPEPTPDQTLSPEMDRAIFEEVFDDLFGEFSGLATDIVESSAWWMDIDKMTYSRDKDRITVHGTTDWESVYRSDPADWRKDTWDFYRAWGTDVWGEFAAGWEDTEPLPADYTPEVRLYVNDGHLTVLCPGSFINDIYGGRASLSDFKAACAFKPK